MKKFKKKPLAIVVRVAFADDIDCEKENDKFYMSTSISILGGGIAGLTAAVALQRSGLSVTVFEAAPTLKPIGAGLVLASNAMRALDQLDLATSVAEKGTVINSVIIKDQKGKTITVQKTEQVEASYGWQNYSLHRADLHQVLQTEFRGEINTDMRVISASPRPEGVRLVFENGTERNVDFLIVADGIHSQIRQRLVHKSAPRYVGYTCWRAVIKYPHLDLKGAYETWGSSGRFGFVPLTHNRIYWFACVNARKDSKIMQEFTVENLYHHFEGFHSPIPEIISATKNEELIWNDIADLQPLDRFAFGNMVLIGDAAHATSPNLGQGACMAIEDAVILSNEMQKNHDYQRAFKEFERRRLERTHWIITTSRRIGWVAQLENSFLIKVRNQMVRLLPLSWREQQIRKLYDIDLS